MAGELKWLKNGKRAAVCFSIDDVHPGRSSDQYDGGGELGEGALGHLERLLLAHTDLKVTLFVTPDWRQTSPRITRRILSRLPAIRNYFYLTRVLPQGSMNIARSPRFVSYLRALPRTEIGIHGLHHVRRGPQTVREFESYNQTQCERLLDQSIKCFHDADLPVVPGLCPPCWVFSEALGRAMVSRGLRFVASARDLVTQIHPEALTTMSGLQGVSLIYPQLLKRSGLLHFTTNFQATSSMHRAFDVLEHGGLLMVKAHIVKNIGGHVMLDGLDDCYTTYLDVLFRQVQRRFGDSVWWTSAGEVSEYVNAHLGIEPITQGP